VADGRPMIDRLRELKDLEAKATPGPWWAVQNEIDHADVRNDRKRSLVTARFVDDAALIAEARNALPKLLAIAEAARFPRNVAVGDGAEMHHGDRFQGEWVAVPAQDFDRLRASVAALDNR
jgi:hypothetical protein